MVRMPHNEPGFRGRYSWICRIWNHTQQSPSKQEISQCYQSFTPANQHHWYPFLVWPGQPSLLCLLCNRTYAALLWVIETWYQIPLGRWIKPFIWRVETSNHQRNQRRRTNLWKIKTHMSRNGLVERCIGFWLFQKHCHCQTTASFCWHGGCKVTLIGSRLLQLCAVPSNNTWMFRCSQMGVPTW